MDDKKEKFVGLRAGSVNESLLANVKSKKLKYFSHIM